MPAYAYYVFQSLHYPLGKFPTFGRKAILMQYRYNSFLIREDNGSYSVFTPDGKLVDSFATQKEAESYIEALWAWVQA